jgi:4-carboxymuconolactone decarboxylase
MNARYEKGLALFQTIAGDYAGAVVDKLDAAAPGFSEALVGFAFADVCARAGLDLKTRELATIAALAALGNAAPQLKLHIGGALNAGCSETEIVEVLLQVSLYAGIPAMLNGLSIASDVFEMRREASHQ